MWLPSEKLTDEPGTTHTTEDLATWQWEQYSLSVDMAGKLGFSVVGMEASTSNRILVAEFARCKDVVVDDVTHRVGVAARLIVRVRGLDAKANLSLPFVAAEAQYNRAEATASLKVEGFVGAGTGRLFPAFGTFDVESYVRLTDSLTGIKNLIDDNQADIRPIRLWTWDERADDTSVDAELTKSVGTVWALTRIKEGWRVQRAVAEYAQADDEVAKEAIRQTYARLGVGEDVDPRNETRARARDLLDGYRMRTGAF